MSPRRADALRPAQIVPHLGVMVAVSAAMGLLVAGLAIPFAALTGFATESISKGMDKLPATLTAEPLAQRTRLLAKDGSVLATFYDQNRVNVPLGKVSLIMREAIVSIEDYRFYQHGALDLRGTLRAFVTNQTNGGEVQGGSSIAQQMVKMTLENQAKTAAERKAATADTYQRKIKELRYAIAFEKKYSKDWILQRYLNIAYFGDGAYGIQAASRHYFNIPASKLNLRQASLLAGLVKNPSGYDPTSHAGAAKARRNTVLARMAQLNVISAADASKTEASGLGLQVKNVPNGCVSSYAAFFCDYVQSYLLADPDLGKTVSDRRQLLYTGGLTIKTTLDPRFQRAADSSMRRHVRPTDQAIGGLAEVVPGTGEVRALSQSRPMGRNKKQGQTFLNYVVPPQYGDSNGFQAGSTFKVFVLSTAIKMGIPLSTRINAPQTVSIPADKYRVCHGFLRSTDVWRPQNSTGTGTFNLYTGTQVSVNTFFAQLEERTGLCEPVRLAREMGVTVPRRDVVPPFTLGVTDTNPLTMASVYATFPGRGIYCTPRPVTAILDSSDTQIATFPPQCKRVLDAPVADAVNDILRGVQEPGGFGYDAGIELNQPSAGKTGTTDSNKAVWFDGYTPTLCTSVMLAGANAKGQPETLNYHYIGGVYVVGAHGSTNAGPIWGDAMKAIEQYLPNFNFVPPDAVTIAGQMATVPTVAGMSPSQAAQILQRAGFFPVIGSIVDSGEPQGTVAYTSPGAGSQLGTSSTVTIYVSDGTPKVRKPPPTVSPSPSPSTGPGNGPGPPGNGH